MSKFLEKHSHWHELPMVECPHCGKRFQWEDYYDVEAGSETDCPKCEKVIHVVEAYTAMHVLLSTQPED